LFFSRVTLNTLHSNTAFFKFMINISFSRAPSASGASLLAPLCASGAGELAASTDARALAEQWADDGAGEGDIGIPDSCGTGSDNCTLSSTSAYNNYADTHTNHASISTTNTTTFSLSSL
jgi:hypothetical protein